MTANAAAPDLSGLRVLVVDDEADIRLGLVRLLATLGIEAGEAADGVAALEAFADTTWDLVFTDLMMPRMSGAELLVEIKKRFPCTEVVPITGFGSVETAVECLHNGASHFLTKPFDNKDILDLAQELGRQVLARRPSSGGQLALVAEDPAMRETMELVARAAKMPVSVLIDGESGTGKEVVARALHQWSDAADKPFLAINCAALPDALLESELFGHARGAFTGAERDRDGVFAQACGGTVFLDEVASMSPQFQGKVLRVLQDRVLRQVGGDRDIPVDFRLVAATNRNLGEMVREGKFREDLYYRLLVVRVPIPALRDRPADILPLALHFLLRESAKFFGPEARPPELATETVRALQAHSWPGNVRELEHVIQRALVVCGGGRILAHHLGLEEEQPKAQPDGRLTAVASVEEAAVEGEDAYVEAKRRTIERFQRQFVQRALHQSHGNVSHAASTCGLSRAAFQKILRQLGIDRESFVAE